jgi:hypothetical protein
MPFTFSHAAAILPFCKSKRLHLSATGLIMGSMVPDFEFLFLLRESDYLGHLWPGFLIFNIPAGIIAAFIFHLFIRNSLVRYLPLFLQIRFLKYVTFNWVQYFKNNYLTVIICIVLGAASHVFIDAFTHHNGFMARPASFFNAEIKVVYFKLPVYFILQLFTSVLGLIYIAWYILKLPKQKDIMISSKVFTYWFFYALFFVAVLVLRFVITNKYNTHADVIISFFGTFLYALLLNSVLFYKRSY